ncbi:MAG: uracil-DNA glycosylase [Deltaproteobacteria bacterium]|nr:uracil-DNA glycosylase [Deltaproteobacteria bacterium]
MNINSNKPAPIAPHEFAAAVDEVRACLLFLKQMGCSDAMIPGRTFEIMDRMESTPGPPGFSDPSMRRVCARCSLFPLNCRPVFGAGPDNCRVMFVGGIPEPEDEESGIPFSGSAGELLTRIIGAMKLDRDSVYITHLLKCRPKGGQVFDRMAGLFCRAHLDAQIKRIKPKIIIALGEYPAQVIFGTSEPIARLRGRFQDLRGIPVMTTHDPAHLIENPSAKRAVWDDLKQVMARLTLS